MLKLLENCFECFLERSLLCDSVFALVSSVNHHQSMKSQKK